MGNEIETKNIAEQRTSSHWEQRLVSDLTGLNPRKRDKILRMIEKLETELCENGLVVFGGGCNDNAILLDRETGIVLGHVANYGVFMGGCLPLTWTSDEIEYSRDLSPTSGDFANVKVEAPPPLESDCAETEKLLGGCSPTTC